MCRRRLLFGLTLVALASLAVLGPGRMADHASAAGGAGTPGCVPPALDFREQQRDEQDQPVVDAAGEPVWVLALATGTDGLPHQLTSAYLLPNARAGLDAAGGPAVNFTLTEEGAGLLAQITTRNTGRRLAIFVDGQQIFSALVITPIIGDEVVISGLTEARAHDLADRLNAEAVRAVNGCIEPPPDPDASP
jgi:preprotein translocase subunit SecD